MPCFITEIGGPYFFSIKFLQLEKERKGLCCAPHPLPGVRRTKVFGSSSLIMNLTEDDQGEFESFVVFSLLTVPLPNHPVNSIVSWQTVLRPRSDHSKFTPHGDLSEEGKVKERLSFPRFVKEISGKSFDLRVALSSLAVIIFILVRKEIVSKSLPIERRKEWLGAGAGCRE